MLDVESSLYAGVDNKVLYSLAWGPVDFKSYWPPKKLLAWTCFCCFLILFYVFYQ